MPLIEVQFNLEKLGTNVDFVGLTSAIKANPKQFVNTDLFLNVVETPVQLEFTCDFNTDLFDEQTIARWMSEWKQLLRSIVATPDEQIARLAMLSEAELHDVTVAHNTTAIDFGAFEPVYIAFLKRAEAAPNSIAIECNGQQWTNLKLAGYASSLAQVLRSQGLEKGGLVALAIERSPEMVGAMLAVMIAGGAYLPLDPRHPAERLETTLADSGAQLLLVNKAPAFASQARVINLSTLALVPASLSPALTTPDSLAYVIYTSGSTGRPKGVAVEHGALDNLLRSMEREPGLTAEDTLVAITTLSFDIAALELLLPLLMGAKLILATDAEVQDGMLLLSLLERSNATVLQATPGAWRILIDAGWTGSKPLKALCGGEALPRELANKILDRTNDLWNVYGPTETTIWSSAKRVTPGKGPVRIGPPIANTQFYVLDAQGQPQPFGVMGELYIGGAGLARGYWQRPELTAEKFITASFNGERIYATGDLSRLLADGSIELLGRTDFQVKVRGYRIELAEIEGALMQHPQVFEAVVVQQKADKGNARLVAYVATGTTAQDDALAGQLRAQLAHTLPEYMLPAAFVVLPKLPRTAHGKIDRKSLPQAGITPIEERVFTPPTTPQQQALATIWAEVLEVPRVGIHDNIFELGADSLLIFRIASRAQREGLALNATAIFQLRTIDALCSSLEQAQPAPVKAARRIAAASREHYRLTRTEANVTIH